MTTAQNSAPRREPSRVKRTSISCPRQLHERAIAVVDTENFGTFSGYVAYLIRLDVERRGLPRRA